MYVPLEDCRSSTHQRCPSVVSWACRRETPESAETSICGWMLRLVDVRPMSKVRSVSGTTAGGPTLGSGSPTPWEVYQSGSTQISATQVAASGDGAGDDGDGAVSAGDGIGGGTGCASGAGTPSGGVSGRGSWPVVKSYPQFSQNRAPGRLSVPQLGHVCPPLDPLGASGSPRLSGEVCGAGEAPVGGSGGGVPRAADAATAGPPAGWIGRPQTSQ